ncbi:MAG: alpha/beta hydrolase fold domain-containing protein [Planctomycetia bacterium]|nr:alpha/beta hydrolase fold domain-containing protein [Planctomycetia bacterium]
MSSSSTWSQQAAPAPEARVDLFTRLDLNKDGKVTREELPERQKPNFGRIDTNADGAISREELTKYVGPSRPQADAALKPTHADVAYGPHERNKIDLYLADSKTPTPLVLFIHGGGFMTGDKRSVGSGTVGGYNAQGWSVAAINYRFTDVLPAPGQYLDCGRALQFIRHNAEKWNINPKLIASTGGSAGAGTSMWLAFHDDLADPKSDDPIARQSTRLTCVVVSNGQSSYDPRFAEKAGIPRPNFERHGFFEPFYGIKRSEADTPEAYRRYDEAAPITYLTKEDPPAMLVYSYANEEVTATSDLGLVVHHPKFGIALKEQMDKLGIECVVQYRNSTGNGIVRHGGGEPTTGVGFILKHFAAASKP